MGRSRALEVILGCADYDADLAERYGYINRAFDPDALGPFVEGLAYRIASFPSHAIALAKQAVDAAELPTEQGLARGSAPVQPVGRRPRSRAHECRLFSPAAARRARSSWRSVR